MIRRLSRALTVFAAMVLLQVDAFTQESRPGHRTRQNENVLLVTLDGLRWQEVFAGADETLMTKDAGGVKDEAALKTRFQRPSANEQRETLMPFFWNVIAAQGVVFGDSDSESKVVVTNGLNFSYPGYNEILCGFADPKVDTNAKKNNENVTVLEWLNGKPEFQNKVAAFCSWDVFPFIINEQRSGIPVNAGWEPLTDSMPLDPNLPQQAGVRNVLEDLDTISMQIPRSWPDVRFDYFTFRGAEEYLKLQRPRVLYVSLGETDDWAHGGRYDLYLDAAQRNDRYIQSLWETMQSLPQYKDNTTLILTTDHGRGDDRVTWKDHGKDNADCQYIWMAVLGAAVSDRKAAQHAVRGTAVTQSQIAATVAACLGYDYCADQPKAARPLLLISNLKAP